MLQFLITPVVHILLVLLLFQQQQQQLPCRIPWVQALLCKVYNVARSAREGPVNVYSVLPNRLPIKAAGFQSNS